MSVSSWKAEFDSPIDAIIPELEAFKCRLKFWQGLRAENLIKHGVTVLNDRITDGLLGQSIYKCHVHSTKSVRCYNCPLNLKCQSAVDHFLTTQSPEVMINLLQKRIDWLDSPKIEKVEEKEKEMNIKFGSAFEFTDYGEENHLGILAQVSSGNYAVIVIPDGNRWRNPQPYGTFNGALEKEKIERDNHIKITKTLDKSDFVSALKASIWWRIVPKPAPKPKVPVVTKSVKDIIQSTKGKIFTVCFMTQEYKERTMNCRTGVNAYVKGTGNKAATPGLVTVYDLTKKGYRSFYTENVLWIKIGGKKYICNKGAVIRSEVPDIKPL